MRGWLLKTQSLLFLVAEPQWLRIEDMPFVLAQREPFGLETISKALSIGMISDVLLPCCRATFLSIMVDSTFSILSDLCNIFAVERQTYA
jgi:hypothetical protein